MPLLYTLLKHPDIQETIAQELQQKLQKPFTPDSLKALPYTFAFVKEVLRSAALPSVQVSAGQAALVSQQQSGV